MFYRFRNQMDVTLKKPEALGVPEQQTSNIIEQYTAQLHNLREEINEVTAQLQHYKQVQGEVSDSLNDVLTAQAASEIITKHLDHEHICQSLFELLANVIRFENGTVYQQTEHGWRGIVHTDPELERILYNLIGEGIIDWLWQMRQPIALPLSEALATNSPRGLTGSILLSPLQVTDEHEAILVLRCAKSADAFSRHELQIVRLLSLQAAIAMKYTKMYNELACTHEELEQSQNTLMHAVKLATIGEVAGGVAHEINNPLQIILGKIQISRMNKNQDDAMNVIEMEAMRIATIVRGLLTLARRRDDNGRDSININKTIKSVAELISNQLEKRKIQTELDFDIDLPTFTGNAVDIQQIFLNYFLNAKRRMPQGGILRVSTRATDARWLHVVIEDTGITIPGHIRNNLKAPFMQLDPSPESETFFGFLINTQMIYELGGSVEIPSPPGGKGNRIEIALPLKEA